MFAIIMAIRLISEVKVPKIVVCSDSSSALISLNERKSKTRKGMIIEIIQELHSLKQISIKVQFLWVPAHIGLKGNEEADNLAEKAIEQETVDIQIPLVDQKLNQLSK